MWLMIAEKKEIHVFCITVCILFKKYLILPKQIVLILV